MTSRDDQIPPDDQRQDPPEAGGWRLTGCGPPVISLAPEYFSCP